MSEPFRVEIELSAKAVEAIIAETTRRVLAGIGRDQRDGGWLTVKAAADYIGLSEHAVRHLLERHPIPKSQAVEGGRILIRRDDLDEFLSSSEIRSRFVP